jgi:integral membrane protein (TIGR00529 family)
MPDILRIALILGIILYLLRKGMGIGHVLLLASGALIIVYGMDVSGIVHATRRAATSRISVALLFSLSLIRIFELVLREQSILSTMTQQIKGTFRLRKAIIISMPMIIGMLPSLGGAYFSAPMVREATENTGMGREEKAFINYWFRHPWEYILPLYPGIVFASAVSGIPLNRLIISNMACAAMMLIAGFIFSMRGVGLPMQDEQDKDLPPRGRGNGGRAWLSFLPIAAVLFLVIVLHLELQYALLTVIVPLFAYYRYDTARIFQSLRYGFSPEVIVLIAGIMLFKETLEISGAVKNLGNLFISHGVPALPLFCLLPFIAGILTGHTVGFVGSTFALLANVAGTASQPLVSLAFAAGFIGVLLSPLHLCLILTKEYFRADLSGIYRMTIPAGPMVLAAAFAQYLLTR